MPSYYGRRASYVASWQNQRIYPRQEPNFEQPPTRSRSPVQAAATPAVAAPPPQQPPPLYFPGEAELARTRALEAGLPAGTTASTNVASSRTSKLWWSCHPSLRSGWRRVVRVDTWWACLVQHSSERLDDEWPEEFGGRRRPKGGDIEAEGSGGSTLGARISRSMSRRSGVSAVDSGVALTPRGTMDLQHPLEPLFKQRVADLNVLIGSHLKRSRVWLSLLEIINYCWLIALLVALGVGKGKQTPVLQAVELSLIVIIVLNGIGVNAVRMRRWALARALRTRSRDWSPLPITTSTNAALLDNAGLNAGEHFFGQPDREALADRVRGKDQPTLRWRMREIEGSWWLSYRPIIKCELVTPSASGLIAYPPPQTEAIHIDEHGHDQAAGHPPPPTGLAPAYSE